MIKISKNANVNYLAKIVELKNLQKHGNADRLQITSIDFQNVITGLEAKDGDIYCYFPIECQINKEFLSFTNSFRHKELNKDKEKVGFFEDNCRVKAMKLRGEKSMGYIIPIKELEKFTGKKLEKYAGKEFDTIGDILMVKKYIIKIRNQEGQGKQGKKPRISRLVDKQVRLQVDTENLRKNIFKINPEDYISITYKVHGTSWWACNLLVKRKLNLFEKFLKLIKIKIIETEYDYVYGSRRVVKNEYETKDKMDFYGYDLWGDIKNEVKEFIPKGYTLYGECLGYTKGGRAIQGKYDYGCKQGEKKLQIYRITFTNTDGIVNDLSSKQIKEFCDRHGLEYVHIFYQGKAKDIYDINTENHWQEEFIKRLEKDYNDKDCFMCKNKVPEEGIVLRKESLFGFESYKLKSWEFLEMESKQLDNEQEDIENIN